jgi:hypothetical protein
VHVVVERLIDLRVPHELLQMLGRYARTRQFRPERVPECMKVGHETVVIDEHDFSSLKVALTRPVRYRRGED